MELSIGYVLGWTVVLRSDWKPTLWPAKRG